MTHDERISSFIDNELTAEQEQEFLISLAASEGLRKSFRSELVLKNVLHHDEAVTNPPRNLRTAVFATLGLGATSLVASKANAAGSQAGAISGRTFIRSLFATKMSALVTAAGISLSALAGYGVHSLVAPPPSAPSVTTHFVVPATPVPALTRPIENAPASAPAATTVSSAKQLEHRASRYHAAHRPLPSAAVKSSAQGVNGSGDVVMEPAKINDK